MKTKTLFCALALLATIIAGQASAEARGYSPHRTTVQQLTENAEIVVVGTLDRVENITLAEVGRDAAVHKRLNDGSFQDGEDYVRREAVLKVNTVLKGNATAGSELTFVSMRQLKLAAYDADLRTGEAIYFISARQEDGRYAVHSDERGTVSAAEVGGDLNTAIDYIRQQIEQGITSPLAIERMLNAITLDGSRLSVDSATELSWHHEAYVPAITTLQRDRILDLCKLSTPGSEERNQLITAAGRHPAENALDGLMSIMLTDSNWSTTSLASMSLEYVNRGNAITRLLSEYELATTDTTRMVIVRSLGLIRPKADHDGADARMRTLELVKGLLKPTTNKDLLREALIASRDLRSGNAHIADLKELIDNRDDNALTESEVKAAIVALAAARTVDANGKVTVIEESYLKSLAKADQLLAQYVDSALIFPYTSLIEGADGKGH
jgi:hypothetical protein